VPALRLTWAFRPFVVGPLLPDIVYSRACAVRAVRVGRILTGPTVAPDEDNQACWLPLRLP
jgi:hypothetical protein